MSGEDLVGLFFGDIENEDGYNSVTGRLGPKVAVDQHETIGGLSGQNGIAETDLGQQDTQGVGLSIGVGAPVFRIRQKLTCWNTVEADDSVFDEHTSIYSTSCVNEWIKRQIHGWPFRNRKRMTHWLA